MKKITQNEITGAYHYEDDPVGFGLYAGIIIAGMGLLLLILEHTGLTDAFINLWK